MSAARLVVPFVDLRAQHEEVRPAIEATFRNALDRSAFIGGAPVASFEATFARFCGAAHGIGVASGTDALELSLRALGVGPGDLVVTVPHTFIATAEAAVQLGAEPRFVDVDTTGTLDPALLAEYLTGRCERDRSGALRERESGRRIAAIVPVHLYGLPADLTPILDLAAEHGVMVVEDACQAHGAAYRLADGRWAMAGTLGQAGCFSFYPGKNLGAVGEAGAIVTNDSTLAARIRLLADHGQSERYVHVTDEGVNARLDALQAAVLEIKLGRLHAWNEARRRAAGWYAEELAGSGIPLPFEPDGRRHVYHLYVVRLADRDEVRARLSERGIGTGLHYPIPLHRQPAFARLGLGEGTFPHSEAYARECLSLPMHPHLTREQVRYVAACLKAAV